MKKVDLKWFPMRSQWTNLAYVFPEVLRSDFLIRPKWISLAKMEETKKDQKSTGQNASHQESWNLRCRFLKASLVYDVPINIAGFERAACGSFSEAFFLTDENSAFWGTDKLRYFSATAFLGAFLVSYMATFSTNEAPYPRKFLGIRVTVKLFCTDCFLVVSFFWQILFCLFL